MFLQLLINSNKILKYLKHHENSLLNKNIAISSKVASNKFCSSLFIIYLYHLYNQKWCLKFNNKRYKYVIDELVSLENICYLDYDTIITFKPIILFKKNVSKVWHLLNLQKYWNTIIIEI